MATLPTASAALSDVGLMISVAANTWVVLRSLGGDHADQFIMHLTVSDILLDLHLPLFSVGVSILDPAYLWAWLRLNLVVGLALAMVPVMVVAKGLAVAAVENDKGVEEADWVDGTSQKVADKYMKTSQMGDVRVEEADRVGGTSQKAGDEYMDTSQLGTGIKKNGPSPKALDKYSSRTSQIGGVNKAGGTRQLGIGARGGNEYFNGIGRASRGSGDCQIGLDIHIDETEKVAASEYNEVETALDVDMSGKVEESTFSIRESRTSVGLPVGGTAFARRHALFVLAAVGAVVPVIIDGGDVNTDSMTPYPLSTFPSLSVTVSSSELTSSSNPILCIWTLATESLLSALNFPLSVLCALPAVVFVLLKQDVADMAMDNCENGVEERSRRSNKRKERLLLFVLCLIYFCIFAYDLLLLTDWLDSTQSTLKRNSTQSTLKRDSTDSTPDQDSTFDLYQEPILPTTQEEWEFPGSWPGPVTKSTWLSSDTLWLSYAFRPWTRVITALSRVAVALATDNLVRYRTRAEDTVWIP